MSLSEILIQNVYNLDSNSLSLNRIAANPGSVNTLWENNSFSPPHLFNGAVDLQTGAVPPPLPAAAFEVYVNKGGNDITGNGSILQPYQTVSYAMSQVTFAGFGFPVVIFVGPGIYNEVNLPIKANVFISGSGKESTTLDISGSMTLGSGWSPALQDQSGFYYLEINGAGVFNLDFTSVASTQGSLLFCDCVLELGNPLNVTGNAGGVNVNQVTFANTVVVNNTVCNDLFVVVLNSFMPNPNSLTVNNTIPLLCIITNSYVNNLAVTVAALMTLTLLAANSTCQLLNANGPINIQCSTDFLPIHANVTLAGGANIIYLNDAYAMGYTPTTPVNWPVVPVNVQQALDNLGAGSGTNVQHDTTLTGNGKAASPLSINAQHDTTLSGNGTVASPLTVLNAPAGSTAVAVDGSLSGNGLTATPLSLNIQHDTSLTGVGNAGSPLAAVPATVTQSGTVVGSTVNGNTILGISNVLPIPGTPNTIIGFANAQNITTGTYNCAIGSQNLQNVITGNYNVGIGVLSTPGGDFNNTLCLGFDAVASSSNEIAMGSFANPYNTSTTASAGAQGALPLTVDGYLIINLNGTLQKFPYYAV
jgi:hypothetical protein